MASITFTVPPVLNGGSEKKIPMSAGTLKEAFDSVCKDMGEDFGRRVLEKDGTPRSLINVYINGKNARFSGWLDTVLKDGDDVYLLPAVAGGSEMSRKEMDRYSRQIMLDSIGYEGQLKLKNARVCVVGVGGIGNPIVTRLAAMGVGKLRIVDRDVIELSNLHRQTMYEESDVGRVKVEAAAEKLRRLNSDVKVEPMAISISENSAPDVVEGCDVVVDALDGVSARYALNKACLARKIPFVTGAAVGTSGQVFTILPGETACYNCRFPALAEGDVPVCSIEGVHPSILSIVGGIEVAEAVHVILGKKPDLAGRLLHVDLDPLSFSFVEIAREERCPVCGRETAVSQKNGIEAKESASAETYRGMVIEELCGRAGGKRTFSLTPGRAFEIDADSITRTASEMGFRVENQGELGLSVRTDDLSVSIMKSGSAMVIGTKDEDEATNLYNDLLGEIPEKINH